MGINQRDYLKVCQYGPFWALDYSSPYLGMTMKFGNEEQVRDEYTRLCAMDNESLDAIICGK